MVTDNTKANILIVNDTPANLDLLGEILEEARYKVQKVLSGPLALKSVRLKLPDLILLDVKMPGMDGYEVCKLLKADDCTRGVPIIFTSALQEHTEKLKAFKAGGVDYVTHPFQAEEVLARIDTHVRLHALQKELTKAKNEAEAANRSKSSFLAYMSHEIRTPMNSIINFTALCQQNNLPETERYYLKKVSSAAQSLLRLINDILDFSKIEAGKLELESIPFHPKEIIDKVASCMGIHAAAKQIDLRVEIAEQLPIIQGDPLRLEQILTNLLSNAIKFTESGSVNVSARSVVVTDKEIILGFCIRDTGIGMDDETTARLFRSFYQANVSTTRHYGGTGLGLAICKDLVGLMGGEIRVESTPGQGSIFHFTARFEPSTLQPETKSTNISGARSEEHRLNPIRGARLLLVEDNTANQLLTRKILSREQLDVDVANNGLQAVEMASATLYDCILMDVQMPIMDGYEATRRIRNDERYRNRPILAMTAFAMQKDRERCFEAGMNDYLPKPIVPKDLFASLAHWIPESIPDNYEPD